MSAASSASRPMHAQAPARPAAPRVARAAVLKFDADRTGEFKMNLADIPREPASLDVEGLKPSLLSRLLNVIAPIR